MNIFRRHPATAIAVAVATMMLVASFCFGFDLVRLLEVLGQYRADEFILPALVLLVGVGIDLCVADLRNKAEVRAQRLHVLQATMRTVQDIVNNFLNQLQMFSMEVESTLPQESKDLLEELIQDTSAKLRKLGALTDTPEKKMAAGQGIDFEGPTKKETQP